MGGAKKIFYNKTNKSNPNKLYSRFMETIEYKLYSRFIEKIRRSGCHTWICMVLFSYVSILTILTILIYIELTRNAEVESYL